MKKCKDITRLVFYFIGVLIYLVSFVFIDDENQIYALGACLGTLIFSCALCK